MRRRFVLRNKRPLAGRAQAQVGVVEPAFLVLAVADAAVLADEAADAIISAGLRAAFPDVMLVTEEQADSHKAKGDTFLIVDPLDGTLNFLHGMPHFAISIGLERDGELRAGIVFDVVRNEMFWAETGEGAWLENRRLRVSARRRLAESVFATGVPYLGKPGEDHNQFLRELNNLTDQVAGIRRFGSAALDLAYVAAGRFDGFWERGLKPWDVAGGAVLVREAGGRVEGLNGTNFMESGDIVAANPSLCPKLAERVEGRLNKKPS